MFIWLIRNLEWDRNFDNLTATHEAVVVERNEEAARELFGWKRSCYEVVKLGKTARGVKKQVVMQEHHYRNESSIRDKQKYLDDISQRIEDRHGRLQGEIE